MSLDSSYRGLTPEKQKLEEDISEKEDDENEGTVSSLFGKSFIPIKLR